MIRALVAVSIVALAGAFAPSMRSRSSVSKLNMQGDGLKIDMRGKTVFVGGVADSTGYGWAIAKACAEAGAKIILGTWPPVLPIFQMGIERGQFEEDQKLSDGSKMEIAKVRSGINSNSDVFFIYCERDTTFDVSDSPIPLLLLGPIHHVCIPESLT